MNRMFMFAKFFNRDMSRWNTMRVTNMQGMFMFAKFFNRNMSRWNTMRVTNMESMFLHAESFKHSLCGPSWVYTKATNNLMFDGSEGSISRTLCTGQPDRELIVRANPATTCPKCGMFKKSGRPSCCAPGGTWYKNCGAAGNKKVSYTWTDGATACKQGKPAAATTQASSTCAVCGSVKKSRKKSCCGRGGSWYKNCGTAGNKKSGKFAHTWFEGIKVCKNEQMSKRAARSFSSLNAAEKYVFLLTNTTAAPENEITSDSTASTATTPTLAPTTTTEKLTTTPAPTKVETTTAAATTRIATFAATSTDSVKEPTTEWIEKDEFYEGFGVSGSVSFFMSLHAMFFISIILLE